MTFLCSVLILCAISFIPVLKQKPVQHDPTQSKLRQIIENLIYFPNWRNKKYVVWTLAIPLALFGYFVPYCHLVTEHCLVINIFQTILSSASVCKGDSSLWRWSSERGESLSVDHVHRSQLWSGETGVRIPGRSARHQEKRKQNHSSTDLLHLYWNLHDVVDAGSYDRRQCFHCNDEFLLRSRHLWWMLHHHAWSHSLWSVWRRGCRTSYWFPPRALLHTPDPGSSSGWIHLWSCGSLHTSIPSSWSATHSRCCGHVLYPVYSNRWILIIFCSCNSNKWWYCRFWW